jgi:hypothetical protein
MGHDMLRQERGHSQIMDLIFKMTLSIPKHASCSEHVDASEENVSKMSVQAWP